MFFGAWELFVSVFYAPVNICVYLMRVYSWPGNIRELQNICERAAVLTNGELITAGLIQPWLTALPTGARPGSMIEVQPEREGQAVCPGVVCDGNLLCEEVV